MNQSSGWVSASLGCVPLVPKSNPLVIASFYTRHFLEMWRSDFFQHYVVFVILFDGLSPASLLHQLKSSECYYSSECVMDFCLLEMHKILYFLNFAKWAVSIPCQTGEGDRLVCLSYENMSVPYYGMAKAKDINDTFGFCWKCKHGAPPPHCGCDSIFPLRCFLWLARLSLKYWLYRFSAVHSEWYSSHSSA